MKTKRINDYDLVIVGAGPSALTAAIYTSRENIKTLLVERMTVGGMAAITDQIDNYPGFPDGITGYELSNKFKAQAERFGAEFMNGEVKSVKTVNPKQYVVDLGDRQITASSLLVATGSQPCRLGLKAEDEYYGRGVHYCATCDGAFYKDKIVVVIGGGNSAVQEAIFLTRFASQVNLVSLFDITASKVLSQELQSYVGDKKIIVHKFAKTTDVIIENNRVAGVKVVQDNKTKVIDGQGVFIFIGLKPNTSFLEGSGIAVDAQGFIETNNKLETNIPGIFASGDVRKGATLQLVSAAGEGATAALNIREYLDRVSHV